MTSAIAKNFYAQDWGDWHDKAGGGGVEIYNHIGATPTEYRKQAEQVVESLEKSSGRRLTEIIRLLAEADGKKLGPDTAWLEDLGYCLGMMATGSGISWRDNHKSIPLLDNWDHLVCLEGANWDAPDAWYNEEVRRWELFIDGVSDGLYAFLPHVEHDDVLETLTSHTQDRGLHPEGAAMTVVLR